MSHPGPYKNHNYIKLVMSERVKKVVILTSAKDWDRFTDNITRKGRRLAEGETTTLCGDLSTVVDFHLDNIPIWAEISPTAAKLDIPDHFLRLVETIHHILNPKMPPEHLREIVRRAEEHYNQLLRERRIY